MSLFHAWRIYRTKSDKWCAWGQLTLRPGRYALVCFESDDTRRGSHYLHGMTHEFVVR